jgi:hypothetical protein
MMRHWKVNPAWKISKGNKKENKGNRSISGWRISWKIIIFDLERAGWEVKLKEVKGFKEIESENYHALPGEIFTQ